MRQTAEPAWEAALEFCVWACQTGEARVVEFGARACVRQTARLTWEAGLEVVFDISSEHTTVNVTFVRRLYDVYRSIRR